MQIVQKGVKKIRIIVMGQVLKLIRTMYSLLEFECNSCLQEKAVDF